MLMKAFYNDFTAVVQVVDNDEKVKEQRQSQDGQTKKASSPSVRGESAEEIQFKIEILGSFICVMSILWTPNAVIRGIRYCPIGLLDEIEVEELGWIQTRAFYKPSGE
ncbi:hypothetical protein SLEP1_g20452 [Rubroshorea leprosula]|uniref:Uncharacterized protein n=1 Tax=Rubroshorea leprosula TaxID=152421 RepID=A0AAV5J8W1_9ROSI|nr:hypothetical protein SLEP1_g20452 [Rubroshorea leprosula]